jgi:hypothetical protein
MASKLRAPMLLVFALFVGGGSAMAATVDVKVPFPFQVQDHKMPAGEYRVERSSDNPAILLIRGEQGTHASTLASSIVADGQSPKGDMPALVFTRGENGYRLKDVWETHSYGREIPSL